MTTPSTPSAQGSGSSQPARVPSIDEQLGKIIRDFDDIWNEMLSVRLYLGISPNDDRAEFARLCRTMQTHVDDLSPPAGWGHLAEELAEDWEALQIQHRRIDWDAMEDLKRASRDFQDRLAELPRLLERSSEEIFPPDFQRWPASADRLAEADRMEGLEAEVQRLQAILRALGGCGEGCGFGMRCR